MTPLRQRMVEDMQLRGLAERTQEAYVAAVRQLAEHYGKSLCQQVSSSGRHQRRFSAYPTPHHGAPVRASGQYIIGYDLSPEAGLLTLAVQSVKPP